jgi:hypothetical protein
MVGVGEPALEFLFYISHALMGKMPMPCGTGFQPVAAGLGAASYSFAFGKAGVNAEHCPLPFVERIPTFGESNLYNRSQGWL